MGKLGEKTRKLLLKNDKINILIRISDFTTYCMLDMNIMKKNHSSKYKKKK